MSGTESVLTREQTTEESEEFTKKTCPRCGAVLFSDMDICYGCLFDFSRKERQIPGMPAICDDEEEGEDTSVFREDEPPVVEEDPVTEPETKADVCGPRDPDSTMCLACGEREPSDMAVRVSMPDVSVVVPLTRDGLLIGREETNDIVLRLRTVSRRHMRLTPSGSNVVLEDLGATNPVIVGGDELTGIREVPLGTSLDVCGARLTLVRA